jgi:hypothetical protein
MFSVLEQGECASIQIEKHLRLVVRLVQAMPLDTVAPEFCVASLHTAFLQVWETETPVAIRSTASYVIAQSHGRRPNPIYLSSVRGASFEGSICSLDAERAQHGDNGQNLNPPHSLPLRGAETVCPLAAAVPVVGAKPPVGQSQEMCSYNTEFC